MIKIIFSGILSSLIRSKWNSIELQSELETLVEKHSKITKELIQS